MGNPADCRQREMLPLAKRPLTEEGSEGTTEIETPFNRGNAEVHCQPDPPLIFEQSS